ncbi:ABC transporter permease [Pseudolabrys sp.]|uniref:ABC transporter permease n=1 Tax=Pseudolabrys sp. TaxID=1960880 RepID=UPI003D120068
MTIADTSLDSPAQGKPFGGAFRSGAGRRAPLACTLIALALAGLTALPLISLARTAALGGEAGLWMHLISFVIPPSAVQTLGLLAGVAALAGIAGAGTAWLVTVYQFPLRGALIWLLPLPLAIPTYIAAYVYADLLEAAGPVQTALRSQFGFATAADYWFPQVRSLPGAILIFGVVLYPYVYLAARAMFQTQTAAFTEAARVLGARPWRLARDVALPLSRPALAVGIALALLECLNDIGASEYLGVRTLTLSVFNTWLNRGSLPGAAQIALAMLTLVVALIALERYGRARQRYAMSAQDSRMSHRVPLRGAGRWLATLACLVPFCLGFLLPAGFLAREAAARHLALGVEPELLRHTLTTLTLAASATAAVLVLGSLAAMAARIGRTRLIAGAVAVAAMGYAIPGTVLALGLLSPIVGVDEIVNRVAEHTTGAHPGLVVAGSSAGVVIAYVVRFLAIAIGLSQAGLARIPGEFEDVARTLGAGPRSLVRNLYLPLARPAMWGAALLVFVDCLKELSATLLLRPLNTETLATYIYQFATRGSFEEGALAALLIVAVGILPVIWLVRFAEKAPARFAQKSPAEPSKPLRRRAWRDRAPQP